MDHVPCLQCPPLNARVQKILFWRWKEDDAAVDELDHVTPHKPEVQAGVKRQREFLVKWHDMSYWHCEWISELQVRFPLPFSIPDPHFRCISVYLCLQLDVYHPAMFRNYMRKVDMDEPPPLEDGSSFGREGRLKENDLHNLEERFYRYGIKPEWLEINRVIQTKCEPHNLPQTKNLVFSLQILEF